MKRRLHRNLFCHGSGRHDASWRHPAASPPTPTDIRDYPDLTQRADFVRRDNATSRLHYDLDQPKSAFR
jgi:hypothetical protein